MATNSLVGGLVRGAASLASRGNRLLILCYHRVLERPDPMLPDTVHAEQFAVQMQALAENFCVLPLHSAVEKLAAGALPRRAACVTFDDGYADNLQVALPILRENQVPATIFVASGYLDGGRMWNDTITEAVRRVDDRFLDLGVSDIDKLPLETDSDRTRSAMQVVLALRRMTPERRAALTEAVAERASSALPDDLMLTSRQLVEMHRAGVEVGAHSVSHPILSNLSPDAAAAEIQTSKEQLQSLIDAEVFGFAYPNGYPGVDYQAGHVRAVADAGYRYAVTTARGTGSMSTDRFQLPRLDPWDKSPLRFAMRLVNEYRLDPTASV